MFANAFSILPQIENASRVKKLMRQDPMRTLALMSDGSLGFEPTNIVGSIMVPLYD